MSNYILIVNFLRGSLCVDSSIRVSRITIRSPLAVAVAFHDLFQHPVMEADEDIADIQD